MGRKLDITFSLYDVDEEVAKDVRDSIHRRVPIETDISITAEEKTETTMREVER